MVERLWGMDSKGHIDVLEEGITVISWGKVWSISHAAGTSIVAVVFQRMFWLLVAASPCYKEKFSTSWWVTFCTLWYPHSGTGKRAIQNTATKVILYLKYHCWIYYSILFFFSFWPHYFLHAFHFRYKLSSCTEDIFRPSVFPFSLICLYWTFSTAVSSCRSAFMTE